MKIKFLAVLLAAFLLLSFAGCKAVPVSAEGDSLVGTWNDSYGLIQYRFEQSEEMKIQALDGSFKGTYQTNGDKITLDYRLLVKQVKDTYTLRLDGDTMYLDDKKFTRKR